jgi:hypothetical protein
MTVERRSEMDAREGMKDLPSNCARATGSLISPVGYGVSRSSSWTCNGWSVRIEKAV